MQELKTIRLDEMENMIIEKKNISLKDLSKHFNISMNTVRNDIDRIIQRGNIKKVYGGVSVINNDNTLLAYNIREDNYIKSKKQLCKKAQNFIEDGDIIFIDSGTTTIHLIEYLKNKKHLTVVTNNIVVIISLLSYDNISVIGIGGRVNHKTKSFASLESLDVLETYNIQKAFMAASAVNIKNGAMNSSFDERDVKHKVVKKAELVYLLCDSSKFGKNALLTYCNLNDVDTIITDDEPSKYKDELKKEGIRII